MKILLLNPNTTTEVTNLLHEAGARAASPGTELVAMTARRGVPYIATRAEAQIGGAIALEMLAEAGSSFDAAIIAAFGDPGLFGARELFAFPVVGLAEAAMLTACMVGQKFSIVTFATALAPWYAECVAMHGLDALAFAPFLTMSAGERTAAEEITKLFRRAVPDVYWFYFFSSLLAAWNQETHHPSMRTLQLARGTEDSYI